MKSRWSTGAALAVALGAGATPTAAQWSGTGEFGLVIARGNSETETVNGRLEAVYKRDRWTNETALQFMRSEESGQTTASRFVLANKTDYALDERSYVLGALRYDRDRFSNFTYQTSAALGYGYKFIDTDRHFFKTEIGPGIRFTEERNTEETETELIGRAFGEYRWTISETAELSNKLLIEAGAENTFLENTTALTVAINSRLALKTGFAVRHNTDVEPERKKTDTLTTVNLVYNF